MRKAIKPQLIMALVLLIVCMAVIPSKSVQADAGPHPSMQFIFTSRIKPAPTILSGKLLECQDEACAQIGALPKLGPQRFECQVDTCSSHAYSYAPYHRLEIVFSDGVTRQSNIFTKQAFASNYLVTIQEGSLEVVEKAVGPEIPFLKVGAPTLIDLLATLAFPILEIVLFLVLVKLSTRTGRVNATLDTYYNWLEGSWLLAILAVLVGLRWTQGLVITLVVELLAGMVYVLLKKRSASVILTVILLLNLITQPFLWITISGFSQINPFFLTLFTEVVVWLLEAGGLYYSQRASMRFREALGVSFVLNTASFVVGSLLPI
jgi:hypothetical protein